MTAAQDDAWTAVEEALLGDEDADVTENDTADGLVVKGALFAVRADSGALAVQLPQQRADDLVGRGIAQADSQDRGGRGAWVVVEDTEDWVEMATEAHQFVGEPAVGRDS